MMMQRVIALALFLNFAYGLRTDATDKEVKTDPDVEEDEEEEEEHEIPHLDAKKRSALSRLTDKYRDLFPADEELGSQSSLDALDKKYAHLFTDDYGSDAGVEASSGSSSSSSHKVSRTKNSRTTITRTTRTTRTTRKGSRTSISSHPIDARPIPPLPIDDIDEATTEAPTEATTEAPTEAPTTQRNFVGGDVEETEAEADVLQTGINQECFLEETAKKFIPVQEGWLLLTSLGKRLLWEDLGSVLAAFRHHVKDHVGTLGHRVSSDQRFAKTLGEHLTEASNKVNFTEAQLIRAEYGDFKHLGLANYIYRMDAAEAQPLKDLQRDLCHGMRDFMLKVQGVEKGSPFLRDPNFLWHMWQESWGAVRVFVKITTQCIVNVPEGQDRNSFLTSQHQDEWKQCKGLSARTTYPEDQFPSAVMACARPDEEMPGKYGRDRNRVVRYFGCGKNRVETEPPVTDGVTENCLQSDKMEIKDFMYSMCSANSISTKECRLFGPFWGVYSHPADSLYGYESPQEKEQCLAKKEQGASADELCAEPQAKAFQGQFKHAMADYIFGNAPPLTSSRSRAWQESNGEKRRRPVQTGWDPATMAYPLPQNRRLDPPLWEMLREAEQGEGMMMISYGYSGAGKTTTLIGDATAPVGGGRGIDGVLSLYLKENARKIDDVRIQIFEVYGRVSVQDGTMKRNTGSGLWGYNIREKVTNFLGGAEAFMDAHDNLDMDALKAALSTPEFTFSIKETVPPSLAGNVAWHDQLKDVLTTIEDIRVDEQKFAAGGEPIAHIRGTVNNPKSSRGTLVVLTNIVFKPKEGEENGIVAPITTVDLAGSEDPAVMVGGFMQFKLVPGHPLCDPNLGKQPHELMARYLANLSSYEEMVALSYCIQLKDVLVECDRMKPERGCVDVTMSSGKTEFVRPKLDKNVPDKWLHKEHNGETAAWNLLLKFPGLDKRTKKRKTKTATFTYEEIFEALEKGPLATISPRRTETNPFSGKGLEDDYSWAERLWDICLKTKKGQCKTKLGSKMDCTVLGGVLANEYTHDADSTSATEVPRICVSLRDGGWQSGGTLGEKADLWRSTRKFFFESIQSYMKGYADRKGNEEFDRHLRYFTSSIGPVVEEAFFINEALNDMKGYLGIWAKASKMNPPGTLLNFWPPADMKVQGKINQEVDYRPGSPISEQGYKIYDFIRPRGHEESYATALAHGQDGIMLVTMLEWIRRLSVDQGKNTKVLVGTFVRSDIPGADIDCEGARASLQFAQDLSDSVGWNRMLPGVLPFFHS